MLQDLNKFLQRIFPNRMAAINTIDNPSCGNTTLVHSFDEIKEDFYRCRNYNRHDKLKSADALYFTPKGNLLIIEMKKYNYNLPPTDPNYKTITQFLNEFFDTQDVPRKFLDSLGLLIAICGYYNYDIAIYEKLLKSFNANIYPILLLNLSDRHLVGYLNRYKYRRVSITKMQLENEIMFFNCKQFPRFLQLV